MRSSLANKGAGSRRTHAQIVAITKNHALRVRSNAIMWAQNRLTQSSNPMFFGDAGIRAAVQELRLPNAKTSPHDDD